MNIAQKSREIGNGRFRLFTCLLLAFSCVFSAHAVPKALSSADIDSQVAQQTKGAKNIIKTDLGARVLCPFQDLEAEVTADSVNFKSTSSEEGVGTFSLSIDGLLRGSDSDNNLLHDANVAVSKNTVKVLSKKINQEFTTSTGGIRQDFIVNARPAGNGTLALALKLNGATVESDTRGVRFKMTGGREFIYGKLRVTDANGKLLTSKFSVTSSSNFNIVVDDSNAVYPVRIDPTIEDADWSALGNGTGINGDDADGATVYALAVDTNTNNLYVGGDFTVAGDLDDTTSSAARYIAMWNGTKWHALGLGTNFTVYALAYDSYNDYLYAGGAFTQAGGKGAKRSANHVARWDGAGWMGLGKVINGTIEATNGVDDTVYALVFDTFSKSLYLGGAFQDKGKYIVEAVNPSLGGSTGPTWTAVGSGMDGEVYALACHVSDPNDEALGKAKSYIYAGGAFNKAGGVAGTEKLALWAIPGKTAQADPEPTAKEWIPLNAQFASADDRVYALACDSAGALYVGGDFKNIGGVADADYLGEMTFNIKQASPNAGVWGPFTWTDPGDGTAIDSKVWSVAVDSNDDIWVGYGKRFGSTSGGWNSTLGNDEILALATDGTTVYAGGRFNVTNGPGSHVAVTNAGGGVGGLGMLGAAGFEGVRNSFTRAINAIAVDCLNKNLYVGGEFTLKRPWSNIADYKAVNYVMKWNGLSWSAMGKGVNNSVAAITTTTATIGTGQYTTVYVGGKFTVAGGVPANYIARWAPDPDNDYKYKWYALGDGLKPKTEATASKIDPVVTTLAKEYALDGAVYAGGRFVDADNSFYVVKITGLSTSSIGKTDDVVFALAYDTANSTLYAGGSFNSVAGVADTKYIAKYTGSWSSLNAGMDAGVVALTVDSKGNMYAGGRFTTVSGLGTDGKYIAKYDSSAHKWSALGRGVNDYVLAMEYDMSDNLYIGGKFTLAYNPAGATAGTVGLNHVGEWDGTQWIQMGEANQGTNGQVNALAYDEDQNLMYVGGSFTQAGDADLANPPDLPNNVASCALRFKVVFKSTNTAEGTVQLAHQVDRPFVELSNDTIIQYVKYGDINKSVVAVSEPGFYFYCWTHELNYNFRCSDVSICYFPKYYHKYPPEPGDANYAPEFPLDPWITYGIFYSMDVEANFGKIIYVKSSATGAGTGNSWDDACTTIQAALAKAQEFDRIFVAKGTYSPGSTRDSTYQMKKFVPIYGGFKGDEVIPDATLAEPDPLTPVLDARDIALNATILEGDIGTKGDKFDNIYNIVKGPNDASYRPIYTRLDGFTIQNAYADGDPTLLQNVGGGVLIQNVDVDISNCTFKKNHANKGGAVYIDTCIVPTCHSNSTDVDTNELVPVPQTVTVTNAVFSENDAASVGGAFFSDETQIKFFRCTFFHNKATDGGAIYFQPTTLHNYHYSTVTVQDSIFSQNEATNPSSVKDITLGTPSYSVVSYSNIEKPNSPGQPYVGTANIFTDPLFVNDVVSPNPVDPAVDLHLKSRAGHYNVSGWVQDAVDSPCIDAGDPNPDPPYTLLEPSPNGGVVNMGAYGNSKQASKTWDDDPAGTPIIVVTAPNGGESWTAGNPYDIKWLANPAAAGGNVNIELWKGGVKDSNIVLATANDGLYNWTVPAGQAYGDDYKVKIIGLATDDSDENFTIVHDVDLTFASGANGAIDNPGLQTIAGGSDSTAVTATPAANYFFINWTGLAPGNFTSTDNPIVVTAEYDDTITANFGTDFALTVVSGSPAGPTQVNQGDDVAIVADAPPAGQHFVNWTTNNGGTFDDATASSTTFTMPAGIVKLTAHYAANTTFTLTLAHGTSTLLPGPGNDTGPISSGIVVDIKADVPPAIAEGYYFSGWTTDDGGTIADPSSASTTYTMPANSVTLTANYLPSDAYDLTVTGGTANPSTGPANGQYYEQIAYEVNADTPISTQYFLGWTTNNGGTFADSLADTTDFTMPSADVTVTAVFKDKVPLTVASGTDNTDATPYNGGFVVSITADAPPIGQFFLNWTGDNNATFANVFPSWKDSYSYSLGDKIENSDGLVFECTTAGTSGAVEPDPWNVDDPITGLTTADGLGTLVWTQITKITVPAPWKSANVYSVGDKIISRDGRYVFNCTSAGTSGAAEPAPWNVDDPITGLTTADGLGTLVWTQIEWAGSSSAAWHPNHIYRLDDKVLSLKGDLFKCTTAGTSDAGPSDPLWQTDDPITGLTTQDNGVVWTQIPWSTTCTAATCVVKIPRNDPTKTVTVTANYGNNPVLTVNQGTGSGTYPSGTAVAISGTGTGYFVNWTLDSGTGTFDDATNVSTNFNMTTDDASITAHYSAAPTLTMVNGTDDTGGPTHPAGADVDITADTPAAGKHFVNWTQTVVAGGATGTFADSTATSTTYTMPDNSATVTANYADNFALTVNSGIGDGTYAPAASVTIQADAPAAGKYFKKWTSEVWLANTVYAVGDLISSTDHANFFKCVAVAGTNTSGGVEPAWDTVTGNNTVDNDVTWKAIASPFADETASTTTFTMPAAAATITANYGDIPTLTVTSGTPAGPDTHLPGTEITITADLPGPNAGDDYFKEWTVVSGGNGGSFATASDRTTKYTMATDDTVLAPTYSSGPTLTIRNNFGFSDGGTTHAKDTPVSVTGTSPGANYKFVNWSTSDGGAFVDASLENTTYTMPDNSATITANYALKTYTLTYATDGNGSITGTNPQTVEHGSDGTEVTAVPDPGYTFAAWSDAGATAARTDTNITADATYTASFTPDVAGYSQVITSGSQITVNANNSILAGAGMDVEFRLRPKVYGAYTDPITNRGMNSTTRAITRLSAAAPSDLYASEWSRSFYLYNRSALQTANRATPPTTTEDWLTANPIASTPCDLKMTVTKADRTKIEDLAFTKVLIAPPVIHSITSWDGQPVPGGVHTNSVILVNGKHFGTKFPTVSMEYTDTTGRLKQQRLKVLPYYAYNDSRGKLGSCMDITNDDSQIKVSMPTRWWTGWGIRDTYSLVLSNRFGITTVDLKTKPTGDNNNPVLTPDTITLQCGESSYYIDVLANDTDADADKLTITLPDRTSQNGGRLSVSKEKIRYSPPRDIAAQLATLAGAPFTDTFPYKVSDGAGGTGNSTVTVTINPITLAAVAPLATAAVAQWDGNDVIGVNQVQAYSTLVITGTDFGEKVPTVEYQDSLGAQRWKRLRVVGTPLYADYRDKANKSYTKLDPTNGAVVVPPYGTSQVRVELPSRFWTGWNAGDDIVVRVTNRWGATATSGAIDTVAPSNALTAVADNFTAGAKLLSGDYDKSNYYLLDVTANDTDANSGKFRIVLGATTSNYGGRVTVDAKTNMIKYYRGHTPPHWAGGAYNDTFTYKLQDYRDKTIMSGSATVTINVDLNP